MIVSLMGMHCGVTPQLGVLAQACNPPGKWSQDSQEFPATWLRSEFEASLGYINKTLSQKNKK
ncbi:hypothetical protein I79_024221 [Cricetulus griseus]|uniref:Uncharacterized protein n=1 Tax=Cricetulus griseus TaxID=10029 RepID=G3IK29_CRIGR|nr:hypothetical protein I79_024221 [Cricetulus griseus]